MTNSPQVYHSDKDLLPKLLLGIIILILLAAAAILGSQIYPHGRHPVLTENQASTHTSPLPAVNYTGDTSNILYPKTNIGNGRQVYYQLDSRNKIPLNYSGVGIYYFSVGDQVLKFLPLSNKQEFLTVKEPSIFIRYLVADFDHWEDIPNSPDKYLVLKDDSHLLPPGTVLPKIRVGFTKSKPDFKTTFVTTLAVENLNTVVPKPAASTIGVNIAMIDIMGNMLHSDLDKLIQPGDALSIIFYPDTLGKTDITDNQGVRVANFINIRRFDPTKELQAELGRQVLK